MEKQDILDFYEIVGKNVFKLMMVYFNHLEEKRMQDIINTKRRHKCIIATINFFSFFYEDLLDELDMLNNHRAHLEIVNRFLQFKKKPEASEQLLMSMRKTMLNLFSYTKNELHYHDLILVKNNSRTLKINIIMLMLIFFNYEQFNHFSLIINYNPFLLCYKNHRNI